MENQDKFSQPSADLFSTAAVRASQGWKKTLREMQRIVGASSSGPVSGQADTTEALIADVQTLLDQGQLVGLTSSNSTVTGVGSSSGPSDSVTTTSKPKSEEEQLQERIFAARMMGAPATVVNNIVDRFRTVDSGITTNTNVRPSTSTVNTVDNDDLLPKLLQQPSLSPAQQAQARMIAAALFNTYAKSDAAPVTPGTSSVQRQQVHLHQPQLGQEKPQDKQPLTLLQQLTKTPQQIQQPSTVTPPQQHQVKYQQQKKQRLPSLLDLHIKSAQSRPQKWSNRPQSTKINPPEPANSGSSMWQAKLNSGVQSVHLQQQQQQQPPSAAVSLQLLQQIPSKDPIGLQVQNLLQSTQSPVVQYPLPTGTMTPNVSGPPVKQPKLPMKLLESMKIPPIPDPQPSKSNEVLQSLKDDGYIGSPNRISKTMNSATPVPRSNVMEFDSTIWPSTLDDDMKSSQHVSKPQNMGNDIGSKRPISEPPKPSKVATASDFRGKQMPKPQQSNYSTGSFLKGVAEPAKPSSTKSTWYASVDAFLQSTKRGGEDTSRKRPLQSTAPVLETQMTTGFFSTQPTSGIPFLSEVETDKTISSIDQRVEMLKQQKAQILQDQMDEFCKEINAYGEPSEPVAKQRKTSSHKGPSSSEKDKGETWPKEREKSRDRDKKRDEDRNRRTVTRSPPRKRPSREMERSQSHHHDVGIKKDGQKSPSPKRSRSGSLEKTKRDFPKDSLKDIDKRQGRYPSHDQQATPSTSESRNSRSPERKRPKSDVKLGEVFVEGRWQRSVLKPSGNSRKDDQSRKDDHSRKEDHSRKDDRSPGHDGKKDKEEKKKSDARKELDSKKEKKSVSSKTSEKDQNKDSTALKTREKKERSNSSSGKTEDKKHPKTKEKRDSSSGSKKSDKTKMGRSEPRSETREKEKRDTSTKSKEKSTSDSKSKDDTAPIDRGPEASTSQEKNKLEVSTPKTDSASSETSSRPEADDQPASSSAPLSSADSLTKSSASQSSATSSNTSHSVTVTSDKGGRSRRSSNRGRSLTDSAGDEPKQQKQEEERPTTEEGSKVTASVKVSPVAGVKRNSISHQMGLLRSLSIEEYVSDKVMVNWFCYLCGTICHSMKLYMSHVKGRKHKILYSKLRQTQHAALKKKLISQLKRLPTKSADTPLQGTIFGSAVKKITKCTLKATPSAVPAKEVCSRCFRPYSCSLEEHLRSQEHKKFEGIRPRCNVCDLIFQKIQQYRKHLTTPAHRKKVAASRKPKSGVKAQTPCAEIKPSDTNTEMKKTMQPKSNVIGSEFITPISGFFCKLCSKFYNNEKTARDVHCATPLHITKTHQYYASRNQTPGTSLKASQGTTQDSGDASTFSGDKTKRDGDSLKVMSSWTEGSSSGKPESADGASSSHTSTLAVKTFSSGEKNTGKPLDTPKPTPKVATSLKPIASPVRATLPETKPAPNVASCQTSTPNIALPKDNTAVEMKPAPEVAITQKATPKMALCTDATPKETEEAIPKIATPNRNSTKQGPSTECLPPASTAGISKECEPKEVEHRVMPMRTRSKRVTAVDDALEKTLAASPRKTRSAYSRGTSATSKEHTIDTQCPVSVETNSSKEVLPENAVPEETKPIEDVPMEVSQNDTIEETPMDTGCKINVSSKDAPSKLMEGPHGEGSPKDAPTKEGTPRKTTPKEATLKESTPREATPKEAAPKEAAPKEAALKKAAPKEAAPKEVEPKKAAPKEATPKEVVPKEATPKEAAPKEAAPKEAAPKEAAPKEAAPKEATPKEATPKEAAPKEAAPRKATSKETTPKEASLKTTLPKEAVPKENTPKNAKPREAMPKAATPNEATSKEAAPNEVKANENSSMKATSVEAVQQVDTTQKTAHREVIPAKATSKDTTPEEAKQKEAKLNKDTPKETLPKDATPKEYMPKKDTSNEDPPKAAKTQAGKAGSSDEMPLKESVPKETESSNQTPKHILSVPRALDKPSSFVPAASTMTVTAMPSLTSPRRTTRSMNVQGKASSVTSEVKSVSLQKQVSERKPSGNSTHASPPRTTHSSDKQKAISEGDQKKLAITETSKRAHGTQKIYSDAKVLPPVEPAENATEVSSVKSVVHKGASSSESEDTAVNVQKTKMPVQKKPSASVTKTSAPCQRNQTATVSIKDPIPVAQIKTEKDPISNSAQNPKPESIKSTPSSSQPKDLRDDKSKSPRNKTRSISPRTSSPLNVLDDESRGSEYFDIDEFMSDDIIVIDEDSGHEMEGLSDEEGVIIDLVGEVSGDVPDEETVDKWIVEDVDMEEGEEEGFEMPDLGDMFAIDEVGGSDDEVEEEMDGMEGHDVDEIEEWEVLSEAEED